MASEEAHRAKSLIISEGYDDYSGFKRSRTTVCYFRVFCASGESPCKCTSYEEADKAKNHNKVAELGGNTMGKKKEKTVTYKMGKQRNPYAVSAWNRSGSGRHPDKKKKNNKLKCRKKVQED